MPEKADPVKRSPKKPWWYGKWDFCPTCKKQVKVKPSRFSEDCMVLVCQECGDTTYEYS